MNTSNVLGVLAVAGTAFSLTGCPGQGGNTPAIPAVPGVSAPAAGSGGASYDPSNKDQLFLYYAATQTGDKDMMNAAGKKVGIYDGNGFPKMDAMASYSAAVGKYGTEHPDEWKKFLDENSGKWKEYVTAHMK